MNIVVTPAKRPSKCKQIFSGMIDINDISVIEGGVSVSIVADGLHSDGTSYRYDLTLSRHEVALLAGGCSDPAVSA